MDLESRDGRNLGATVGMLACSTLGVGMLPVILPLGGVSCASGCLGIGLGLLEDFERRREGKHRPTGGLMGVLEFDPRAVAVSDVMRCQVAFWHWGCCTSLQLGDCGGVCCHGAVGF